MSNKVVIESPLAGDFTRNFRFLLWCCRAVWLKEGGHAIASHMLNPWFMDDTIEAERTAGIYNPWVWTGRTPHAFFTDLGVSRGMTLAEARCKAEDISYGMNELKYYHPYCWAAFERGEWPPHTPGFEVAP